MSTLVHEPFGCIYATVRARLGFRLHTGLQQYPGKGKEFGGNLGKGTRFVFNDGVLDTGARFGAFAVRIEDWLISTVADRSNT